MKKIIISDSLRVHIDQSEVLGERKDVKLLSALTVQDMIDLHAAERASLIIADGDTPGVEDGVLYSSIRKQEKLKSVSILVIRSNHAGAPSGGPFANLVLTRPVNEEAFLRAVRDLLNVRERLHIRAPIKVTVKGSVMNEYFICKSVNMSSSGMLVETRKILAKGDTITCAFVLPEFGSVTVEGQVIRVIKRPGRSKRYGIKFSKMAPDQKRALESFFRKRVVPA